MHPLVTAQNGLLGHACSFASSSPLHPGNSHAFISTHAMHACRRVVTEKGPQHLPPVMAIVTDVGKVSREQGNCIVKEASAAMMNFWEAPFRYGMSPADCLWYSIHSILLQAAHASFWAQLLCTFLSSENALGGLAPSAPCTGICLKRSDLGMLTAYVDSASTLLKVCLGHSSYRPVQDPTYAAVLEGNAAQVADWVSSPAFTAQLSSFFPTSDTKVRWR